MRKARKPLFFPVAGERVTGNRQPGTVFNPEFHISQFDPLKKVKVYYY
jgi:hypothetical protein